MNIPLEDAQGLPKWLVFILAMITAVTLSNCYYIQPLLGTISQELVSSQFAANFIVTMTQIGYGLGLFFLVPLGDLISARKMTTANFLVLIVALGLTAIAGNVSIIWVLSLFIGACSVMPQIYIPFAARYSLPNERSKNISIIVSGLLVGILGSRIISGYISEHFGWRYVFWMGCVLMFLCLVVNFFVLPKQAHTSFQGTYRQLIGSIWDIFKKYPYLRIAAFRAATIQGSFFALWAPLSFKLQGSPFYAGDDVIGFMGIFGIIGAVSVIFIGRYINILGVKKVSMIGAIMGVIAWSIAWILQDYYIGIILCILLLDAGTQCSHLANQSSVVSLDPKAINRINTIYMTIFFVVSPMGTLIAGAGWTWWGWEGVVCTGLLFTIASLLTNLWDKGQKSNI